MKLILLVCSLTKQRITLNSSNHHDDRSTSYHVEPPKKVKFESIPSTKTSDEANQDSLIRHLQSRISDLRDDNKRLRDTQQSKSMISSFHEVRQTKFFPKDLFLPFRMTIPIHFLRYVQGIIHQHHRIEGVFISYLFV